jgi:hypothetical protein
MDADAAREEGEHGDEGYYSTRPKTFPKTRVTPLFASESGGYLSHLLTHVARRLRQLPVDLEAGLSRW